MTWDSGMSSGGAPATLIYPGSRVTREVSSMATGRSPSWLQLYLLVYKEDRILSLHRWKLPAVLRGEQFLMESACIRSARPTLSG